MAAPASAWSVFDDAEDDAPAALTHTDATDTPAASSTGIANGVTSAVGAADAPTKSTADTTTTSDADAPAERDTTSASLLRAGVDAYARSGTQLGRVVSVAYQHTFPHVAEFLKEHLTATLEDLDSQACVAEAGDAATLKQLHAGLSAIHTHVQELQKLWKRKGRGGGGEKPSAGVSAATGAADDGDAVGAVVQGLLCLSDSTQQAAFGRLERSGAWPHVVWREAFVMASITHAAAAAHVGEIQTAMRDVDLALILGAPATAIEAITKTVDMASTAVCAAHRAITRAHLAGAHGSMLLVPAASLSLPTIPAVLTSAHDLDIPEISAERNIPRVAARPLQGGKRRRKAAASASAPESASASAAGEAAEHPRLAALRAVTDSRAILAAEFRKRFVKLRQPAVLCGATKNWAALDKWRDLQHLNDAYGHRTVPVEIGQHLSGYWKEQPMLLRDFLTEYMGPSVDWGFGKALKLPRIAAATDASAAAPAGGEPGAALAGSTPAPYAVPPQRIAYLAQHGLFEQIPDLTEDFDIPMYAGDEVGAVNAWFGTAGTVTRLHFDGYENLLTQVVGYKYLRLYAPSETPKLYPIAKHAAAGGDGADPTTAQGNISAIEVERLDVGKHPLAATAKYFETVLGPGDILYIPTGWWHYVRSLTPSFSINFWF